MQEPKQLSLFIPFSRRQTGLAGEVRKCTLICQLLGKYGAEIITDLIALFDRQFWNLSDVARKHGFSREYARQIFTQIFGIPYSLIREKKTRLRMINEGRAPGIYW